MSDGIELEPRECPVCRSGAASQLHAEANFDFEVLSSFAFASRKLPEYMHYRLMRCVACDVIYSSPAPTDATVEKLYTAAAYDSSREARDAAKTYARYAFPFLKDLYPRGRAMDIGAGDGAFLEELLKFGFAEVEGVEPSVDSIDASAPHVRPLIRQGFFHESDHEPNQYSAISCFQTLEHLRNPADFCASAFRLLRPGGAFLGVTHNHRASINRLLKRKSPVYDIEHFQLFSPTGMKLLLEKQGFSRVMVVPILNRYSLGYFMRLAPFPTKLKPTIDRIGRTALCQNIMLPAPFGNLLTIGWK